MHLRSDAIKKGLARAPHRSLLKADGLTDEELERPLVAVVSAQNEVIPGHIHLQQIADAVKAGVRLAGGTPLQINTIGVCDGIAMNHEGMRYSLTSREVIADSVECAIQGHQFDAMVLIPSCDKIVPGMLIAAGGPIALVHEGEIIDIDIEAGTLELCVEADELERRRAAWQPPEPKYTHGVLSRYAKLVTSADKGAYLS